MQYREIPYVKMPVSRLIIGSSFKKMNAGEEVNGLLDELAATGVNIIDTARVYGRSEEMLGNWMESRGNRDKLVILSKCGHPLPDGTRRVNPQEMLADFKTSTEMLKTGYIDIYILHRDDPEMPVGPIVETFNDLHAAGKIGAFGGSNWTHQRIEEANEYAYKHDMIPFTVSSPNFGLANQVQDPWGGGCVTLAGPAEKEARKWYIANQMPVISYSGLGHGLFTGRLKSDEFDKADTVLDQFGMLGYGYPENFERLKRAEELAEKKGVTVPEIALAYLFTHPMNAFAVVSTTSPERMRMNIGAMDIELTQEERDYLDLNQDGE